MNENYSARAISTISRGGTILLALSGSSALSGDGNQCWLYLIIDELVSTL